MWRSGPHWKEEGWAVLGLVWLALIGGRERERQVLSVDAAPERCFGATGLDDGEVSQHWNVLQGDHEGDQQSAYLTACLRLLKMWLATI